MINESIKSLIEFTENIVSKPAMFLVHNVEDLGLVLFGYNVGKNNNDIDDFLSEFRIFVNKKLKVSKDQDYDWVRLIRFFSGGDKHSLELFGILFNEFIDKFGKSKWKI